jgi:protein-tyrosine phosphatase
MAMERRVLFLCTGNYYRSRFAEAVFNHEAILRGLPWRAFSRGLAVHLVDGAISPHTEAALQNRKIDRTHTAPGRQQVADDDLRDAHLTIAVKKSEHLPLMEELHPQWSDKITYWDIHDLDFATPADSLPILEARVKALVEELAKE